jgi:hypothetical protein
LAGRRGGQSALADANVNTYDDRWRNGKPVIAGTEAAGITARLNGFD